MIVDFMFFCFFYESLLLFEASFILTLLTVFALESRSTRTSISLICETGLTSGVVLARRPPTLSTVVLERKREGIYVN